MRKIILLNLILLCLVIHVNAQDFAFGSLVLNELEMPKYKNDESAHAVVLNEYGDARLTNIEGGRIRLIYTYHVKVKIFDNDGFAEGTVEIPLYNSGDMAEEVDEIKAVTMFKEANGNLRTEELLKNKIYSVKETSNHSTTKFALPGLRSGCIVEYTYRITSPYFEGFHEWKFQKDIPKVRSFFEAHIPAFWTYNAVLRGGLKLSSNTSAVERECFTGYGAKGDCSHLTFEMKDIPAFIVEDYMTAQKNFISAINFELAEYTNPYDGRHVKVAKEWKDVDYLLKKDESFGSQFKRKDLLKDRMAPVIAGLSDPLAKAKAVYAYIQKNMKWNEYYSIGSDDIRKALDKHTGNVGDINLSLVAALNAAGLNTEAVLLSTRNHGVVNKLYPVITEFNYVIARVTIADKSYLLDATDPLLSFGMLPMHCLNDKGRAMSIDKPSFWIDMTTSQTQNSTYLFNLALQDNGKLKGTIIIKSSAYAAFEKRKHIKGFNTVDEYVENLDEKLPGIKIIKSAVTNVDSLDLPVNEVYDVEINAFESLNHDKVSFNPYLFNRIVTNPFKLADRTFPVDWGMPSDTRFVLSLMLPDGYSIENPPQPVAMALPNDGGRFIIGYQPNGNSFSFSSVISFKKSIYSSDEYPALKELYNRIILEEKSEMIFKKKM